MVFFNQLLDMRSEEHTSELQSRFGISYAVFCLKKKKQINDTNKQYTAYTDITTDEVNQSNVIYMRIRLKITMESI